MSSYQTDRTYSSKILLPGNPEYEICRRNNPNSDTPDLFPQEIHVVHSVDDVSAALKRAAELGTTVGVRSGGHTLSNGHLNHGIFVDTSRLNRRVDYDPSTHEIAFGPAVRNNELGTALSKNNRFYPHGHCPSVAVSGYHLGGGQGFAMRGFGPASRDWLIKLEVVVPDGRVVIASPEENTDLFWAARGGGPAFPGVITKFWGRTIPATKLWEQSIIFELGKNFKPLMKWFLAQADKTPRLWTEVNSAIAYDSKLLGTEQPDQPSADAKLVFLVVNNALTETEAEAKALLKAYEAIPDDLRDSVLEIKSTHEISLDDMFSFQNALWTAEHSEKWQLHGLCFDQSVDLDKASVLLDIAEPRLTDIPTTQSVSIAIVCNFEPAENECAFSTPMYLYWCSFTGWRDDANSIKLRQHFRNHYKDLLPLSSGMYACDYDVLFEEANASTTLPSPGIIHN
ncbi:hypothetical protein MRS44_016063 [Fusarium solani]|uniref:uncharacterized protein n=1 Tax=Fusarium solani TaxID=169388 RepID=UPI0032C49E8F|nr:hypothetical protein MRS44_016063 [Fusarium solani]